ncbi:MAG TPA: sigma-70 family RNA polymerase sigma factor [Acidobacteriota bacterium]|nr:sigma-70 family RNA polymerase sigma factor [Acidobacteriota bacterium]
MHVLVRPLPEPLVENNRAALFSPATNEYKKVTPDEELVKRSLNGEEDAFRKLYERYWQPLYAAVYRILLDPEEARDTTQEVFIAVHRSLAVWNPQRANFSPWIYRLATNRAIDHWRLRRRRAEVSLTEIPEMKSRHTSPSRDTLGHMEKVLERKEKAADVQRFLETLPQPQRQFVFLRYFEGMTLNEIAEMEGCKLGTVKSVLHRATNALRLKLRQLYPQHPESCVPNTLLWEQC